MKQLLLLIAVSLLLVGSESALAVEEGKAVNGYVQAIDSCRFYKDAPGGCLNVRLGPGIGFKKVEVLRLGAIVEIDREIEGKNGRMWYRIKQDFPIPYPERLCRENWKSPKIDPKKDCRWFIAADYVKRIEIPKELKSDPLKTIVIDISEQKYQAYYGKIVVREAYISTGINGTETPKGEFKILYKKPSRYMQGPLPGMTDYYDLPGVPWAMYFTWGGAAIHGAYWHNDFGRKRSHGCVNLPIDESEWLYGWAAVGTKVIVVD